MLVSIVLLYKAEDGVIIGSMCIAKYFVNISSNPIQVIKGSTSMQL